MPSSGVIDYFGPSPGAAAQSMLAIAQLGQSLDGRIATISGESRGIGGPAGLDHLHRLRAQAQAVIVGVGTVEADDPELSVRRVDGQNPLKVIIDPRGRMSRSAQCLGGSACLVITAAQTKWPSGIEVLQLPSFDGRIDPRAVLCALTERGLWRVLIEGGATTISRFIDAGCIDRLHIVISPLIIGSGRIGLELSPRAALASALRPTVRVEPLGDGDTLFECDLRGGLPSRWPAVAIYKIMPEQLWRRAQEIGRFTGAAVDLADGFIHFSTASQVAETAVKHFAGQSGLLLVAVDAAQLGSALRWEPSRGGALFPHLYGDLPLSAIVSVLPLREGQDGSFEFEGLFS